MANTDGIEEASQDTNIVKHFVGGCFSFAFGSEIALVLNNIEGYFILNCDKELFNEVKKEINSGKNAEELITFWIDKSMEYPSSAWSNDFDLLKTL